MFVVVKEKDTLMLFCWCARCLSELSQNDGGCALSMWYINVPVNFSICQYFRAKIQ